MRKVNPCVSTSTLLSFLSVLAFVAPVSAQTFYGVADGVNYAGTQQGDHYSAGFALQASIGRQFGDRLGIRVDAFVNHFGIQQVSRFIGVALPQCVTPPCSNPAVNNGVTPAAGVGVAGVTASELFVIDPPAYPVRMYLIAGPGAYYYQGPGAAGAVRAGLSAGGGFSARVSGRTQLFVEARYHHLFGAPSQPTWLVPLTFGIRF